MRPAPAHLSSPQGSDKHWVRFVIRIVWEGRWLGVSWIACDLRWQLAQRRQVSKGVKAEYSSRDNGSQVETDEGRAAAGAKGSEVEVPDASDEKQNVESDENHSDAI